MISAHVISLNYPSRYTLQDELFINLSVLYLLNYSIPSLITLNITTNIKGADAEIGDYVEISSIPYKIDNTKKYTLAIILNYLMIERGKKVNILYCVVLIKFELKFLDLY